MLSHMSCASGVAIVIKVVEEGVCGRMGSHKSDIVWDVDLLCEVLDVQPNVDHLPVIFAKLIKSDQERACHLVDHSWLQAKEDFDLLVTVKSLQTAPGIIWDLILVLCWVLLLLVLALNLLLQEILGNKRAMNFEFFTVLINF